MTEPTQTNEAPPVETRKVVLSRPLKLRRDDGSEANYPAGPNTMPIADAEHWFTQHHLAPDGQAPLELAGGEPSAGGVQAIIMQRDTAQRDIQTLQTEVRRVTDLWTEAAARKRALEVELATLKDAQGNAQPKAAPAGADSQRLILEGRLSAASKDLSDARVREAEALTRAEQAEAAVVNLRQQMETVAAENAQLRQDLNNVALAESGGAAQEEPLAVPPVLPETEADQPDEPPGTPASDTAPALKVVKYKGKFYVEKDGERSAESYASHPAAQEALDALNKGVE